jgi:hypothetical protein
LLFSVDRIAFGSYNGLIKSRNDGEIEMKKVGGNNSALRALGDRNQITYNLMADVVGGVRLLDVDIAEDFLEIYEAIDGEDFYNSLADCGEDQVVICYDVSQYWKDKIEAEYGIN